MNTEILIKTAREESEMPMSFSSRVKEELSRQSSTARHCQIAETAAIISLCGRIQISEENKYCVRIQTENVAVARKYFTLLKT